MNKLSTSLKKFRESMPSRPKEVEPEPRVGGVGPPRGSSAKRVILVSRGETIANRPLARRFAAATLQACRARRECLAAYADIQKRFGEELDVPLATYG